MNTITLFFIFIPILAVILLFANLLLAVHRPDSEKVTPYECGFSPVYGQTRNPFSIQFYLVGILFLVFDIEILLTYPYAMNLYQTGSYGFWVFILFFLVLTVGFVYEFGTGALYFTDKRSSISTKETDLQNKSPFWYKLKIFFIKSVLFITRYLPLHFSEFSNYVLNNVFYSSLHFIVFITNVVLFTNSQVDITNVVNGYITCHYYLFVIMLILVSMNKLGLVYKIGIIQVHIFVGLFITLIKYGICSNTIHFLLTSYNNDDFTVDIANTTSMSTLGSTIAYNSSISTLGKECIPWNVNEKVLKEKDVIIEMLKYISKEPLLLLKSNLKR